MLEEPIVTDCDAKEAYLGASLDLADVWLTCVFCVVCVWNVLTSFQETH